MNYSTWHERGNEKISVSLTGIEPREIVCVSLQDFYYEWCANYSTIFSILSSDLV